MSHRWEFGDDTGGSLVMSHRWGGLLMSVDDIGAGLVMSHKWDLVTSYSCIFMNDLQNLVPK